MGKQSINRVILVGNVGRDPELGKSETGTPRVELDIATGESWKDRKTGEDQQRTEWHQVVFFGKLAERAVARVHKGAQVYIEGSLKTKRRRDANGTTQYTKDIVGAVFLILGKRSDATFDPRELGDDDHIARVSTSE